jgi:hypothetical protein
MRPILSCILVLLSIKCFCADIAPAGNQQEIITGDPEESAWQNLNATLHPQRRTTRPARSRQSADAAESTPAPAVRAMQGKQPPARWTRTDWQAVARESRAFIARHPNSKYAGEARKLELTAGLAPARGRGRIAQALETKIEAYLADSSVIEADRYEISAMHREARMELHVGMSMEEITGARLENARALAAAFPREPRAWTSLLNAARNVSLPSAMEVATQIINSAQAPDDIKRGAQQLLDKHALLGKPLAGVDLSSASGKPALLYFWTFKQPPFIGFLRLCAEIDGIALIGINIDDDETAARAFAAKHSPPGRQFYEGADSPAAKQLHIDHFPAMLVLDQNGVLLDYANSAYGAFDQMKQLAGWPPAAQNADDAGDANDAGNTAAESK